MKGLNRTQLKFIAICAMVCDHVAWGFVEFMSPLGQIMHIIKKIESIEKYGKAEEKRKMDYKTVNSSHYDVFAVDCFTVDG